MMSFLCHFGLQKAPQIEPKMGQKMMLEPKGRILENDRESNAKHCFFTPEPLQNRLQDATFSLFNLDVVLGSLLAPFWLPKWLPLGTLLATKIDQKRHRKLRCFWKPEGVGVDPPPGRERTRGVRAMRWVLGLPPRAVNP